MQTSSSNLKELTNLVDTLTLMGDDGKLEGQDVFLFTDNQASEDVYYNGTSSDLALFCLVLELKKLEMFKKYKIRIIHVAGTRIQEQGTDGMSCDNLSSGVMGGDNMTTFIPIHINPFECALKLKPWILSWACPEIEFLTVNN